MSPHISIVADVPTRSPKLGFENYANALTEAVLGGSPPQFTIGIYGPWGSGKSSLLNAVQERLSRDTAAIPVFFDAWRYEKSEHIIIPLLHSIYTAGKQRRDGTVTSSIKRALLSVARSMNFSFGPVNISSTDVVANYEQADNERIEQLDAAFQKPFQDMLAISDSLNGKRIVVLIDDLDRCSSAKAVDVLEAINLVMDVPGFVFVLALDYDVLVSAVSERYPHASGHVFIEKMVQVPFRVPRLDLDEDTFLEDLIPNWKSHARNLDSGFTRTAFDVVTIGLNANPRQIKRFINSVLVVSRVAKQAGVSANSEELAALVGLQLIWPKEYLGFSNQIFADADNPYSVLVEGNDEPGLARYAQRFFSDAMPTDRLKQLLMLTSAVASPDAASTDALVPGKSSRNSKVPADAERASNKAILTRKLKRIGFREKGALTAGNATTAYYNRSLPDSRFVFEKTVVRFEIGPNPWKLHKSYLLTRGAQELSAILDNATEDVYRLRDLL